MSLAYEVNRAHNLIIMRASGVLTENDLRAYLEEMRKPEYRGLNELVDLSQIDRIDYQSPTQVINLVAQAAKTDSADHRTKFAIVAASDAIYGLSRIYQSYREAHPGGNREVRIFRSLDQAYVWLNAG